MFFSAPEAGNLKSPVLYEDQICLRPLTRQDYLPWREALLDDEQAFRAVQPTWPDDHLSRTVFQRRVRQFDKMRRQFTGYSFAITRSAPSEFVGVIYLLPILFGQARRAEIGYWIARPHRRSGYGRSALSALTLFSFETLHLERLEAYCLPENKASIGLLKTLQFQEEGLLRSYLEINGTRRDHLLFARTA